MEGVVHRLVGENTPHGNAPGTTPTNPCAACTGDPNVETNWQHAGMFSGGRAVISGIVPGKAVWFRVRTAGLKGVMGAWSDPAKIMVV